MSLYPYKIVALRRIDEDNENILPYANFDVRYDSMAVSPVYSNSEGSPFPVPFQCGANGEANIWLNQGRYKIKVGNGDYFDVYIGDDYSAISEALDISGKEEKSNKSQNLLNPSAITYPSTLAVASAIADVQVGYIYKGTWDSQTNNPHLESGIGEQGERYVVDVGSEGSTELDGNSLWSVGDSVVFSAGAWRKVPVISELTVALALKANIDSPALTGNPTAPTPDEDDSSTSIATTEYVQVELSDRVQSVATIADLRAVSGLETDRSFFVLGHTVKGKGGGLFVSDITDTTTPDDNGVTIVSGTGLRFKRQDTTRIHVHMFGALEDGETDDSLSIRAAANYVKNNGGGHVYLNGTDTDTYILSNRFYWLDNVHYVGSGKTLVQIAEGIDEAAVVSANAGTETPVKNCGATGIIFDGNVDNAPRVSAVSVVSIDPMEDGAFVNCKFRNASGYGLGAQYFSASIQPDNNRTKNILFYNCEFSGNGVGKASGGDTYDGIDVKCCNGMKFIFSKAYNNYDKGFDFRGIGVELVSCEAWGNGNAGACIAANTNGFTQSSSLTIVGGRYHNNTIGLLVDNGPIGGTGETGINVSNAECCDNVNSGIELTTNNTRTSGSINAICNRNNHGIRVGSAGYGVILDAVVCRNNTASGIHNLGGSLIVDGGVLASNAVGYSETPSAARNLLTGGLRMYGNSSANVTGLSGSTIIDPSVLDYAANSSAAGGDVIASANSISLPFGGSSFVITGSTPITSIAPASRGRVVNLRFQNAITLTPTSTLSLVSTYTTAANGILTLVFEGGVWREVSRAVR